jgi:hypothetical protein
VPVVVQAVAAAAFTGTLGLPGAVGDISQPRTDLAGDARLSSSEEAALRDLLAGLENTIRTRGIEIPSAFQDFDVHRRGIVPVTQFRRIMDRLGESRLTAFSSSSSPRL